VTPADACSFCDTPRKKVAFLVAGTRASICEKCAVVVIDAMSHRAAGYAPNVVRPAPVYRFTIESPASAGEETPRGK
jgi:hypothetical protein